MSVASKKQRKAEVMEGILETMEAVENEGPNEDWVKDILLIHVSGFINGGGGMEKKKEMRCITSNKFVILKLLHFFYIV